MNTNCLAGIACPRCGYDERFSIVGVCTFDVTDDGSEAVGDHEWDDESTIVCASCSLLGKIKDFKKGKKRGKPRTKKRGVRHSPRLRNG